MIFVLIFDEDGPSLFLSSAQLSPIFLPSSSHSPSAKAFFALWLVSNSTKPIPLDLPSLDMMVTFSIFPNFSKYSSISSSFVWYERLRTNNFFCLQPLRLLCFLSPGCYIRYILSSLERTCCLSQSQRPFACCCLGTFRLFLPWNIFSWLIYKLR